MIIGQILGGHYQIIKLLGRGAFGESYLAEDTHLPDRPLRVVKRLQPQFTSPSSLSIARRLFDTEAKILSKLGDNPQIPKLFAHFEENQQFYLVQEYIDGHDLSREITPGGTKLGETEVIKLLEDILEVLVFVHQERVIHRDIKPQNLMRRTSDGKIILIDFGAVKQISTQQQTQKTIAIGTPGYMPLEQLDGNPKLCSDVYAVGMVAIQAITGIEPNQLPKDPETGEVIWKNGVSASP